MGSTSSYIGIEIISKKSSLKIKKGKKVEASGATHCRGDRLHRFNSGKSLNKQTSPSGGKMRIAIRDLSKMSTSTKKIMRPVKKQEIIILI